MAKKLLDSMSLEVTVPPAGGAEIADLFWKDDTYYGIWRYIEGSEFGSGQGDVETMVSWTNQSGTSVQGHIEVSVTKANGVIISLPSHSGNDTLLSPGESIAVMFFLPLVLVPPSEQGDWQYTATLTNTVTDEFYDSRMAAFTVGAVIPVDYATWEFYEAGFVPRHLPDAYTGEVILADLDLASIPPEVQSVYWFDDASEEWLDWSRGAPGNTLTKLVAGEDYMVTVTGACVWNIPLPDGGNGYLELTKAQLLAELEAGNVAADWWSLPDDAYRRELGIKIVQWFSCDYDSYFGDNPNYGCYWDEMPDWIPYLPDDHHQQFELHCSQETGLRYCLIGGQVQMEDQKFEYYLDGKLIKSGVGPPWFYSKWGIPSYREWRPARMVKPFLLPVGWAGTMAPGFEGHWICALQVGQDMSQWNSWVFFQYQNPDIQPGDPYQMPAPGFTDVYFPIVKVGHRSGFTPSALEEVAHFDY